MFNRGATVSLTTGFPKFGASYMVAGGFAGFDPTQFSDFRASSGSTVFQPTIQSIKGLMWRYRGSALISI